MPRIDELLQPLAETLALDGGLLRVESLDDTTLTVRLELADDACQECIVPDPVIADMVLARLTELPVPRPTRVEVLHGPGN